MRRAGTRSAHGCGSAGTTWSRQSGRELAAHLKPGASPKDAYPLSAAPAVPTAFAYARFDEFFAPAWSRWVARDAGLPPVELPTGHFPMVEAPDELTRVLETAAP